MSRGSGLVAGLFRLTASDSVGSRFNESSRGSVKLCDACVEGAVADVMGQGPHCG